MQYLIDNLEYIVENKEHPDWHYFDLVREHNEASLESVRKSLRRAIAIGHVGDYQCLAEAAIDKYPDDAELRLIGSKLLARTPDPFARHVYFYLWHRSVVHLCRAVELCQIDHPLSTELRRWIAEKGMYIALSVRQYVTNSCAAFGGDIDACIARLGSVELGEGVTVRLHEGWDQRVLRRLNEVRKKLSEAVRIRFGRPV